MRLRIEIEKKDRSAEFQNEMEKAMSDGMRVIGVDLQRFAQAAAPEKTGNLKDNITVKYSSSSGAYQDDFTSTAVDPKSGHDYVNWMHNGKYRLGAISAAKGSASSRIANVSRKVGNGYLVDAGTSAKSGYTEYLTNQMAEVSKRYSS